MKKAQIFWPLAFVVVVLDFVTKRMALGALHYGEPKQVFGDVVRFTLGFNPGIAFGLSQYPWARPLLIVFTVVAICGIIWIFRTTDPAHKAQIVSLGFILGGAIGNLLDRLMRAAGVADFIDIGVGATRFWTFNVADFAITTGAILLVLSSFGSSKPRVEAEG